MIENFKLYELGRDAYVTFTSENGNIELKIPKHKYLFTARGVHLLEKLMDKIEEYGKEMYEDYK